MKEEGKSIFVKFKIMLDSEESYFFDSHEYEEIIDYYIEKGEFEIAQKACEYGVIQYPYSSQILFQKSQLSILIQKVDESIDEIHAFFKVNGFDENLLYVLSSHYSQQGKLLKSLQCLDKIKSEFNTSTELHYQYGASYFVAEDYKNAIKHFKKSLELDIKNEDALYDLAFCLELEGELIESISFYQKFIDNDPYSCYAWYNLGVIYNKLEQHIEAINCFEFAYTIKEDLSSAYYNIGNSYVCLKEWDKAIAHFNLCKKYEQASADLYSKIGECYELKNDSKNAVNNYRKALDLEPDKEAALIGIANVLHDQGKNKEAIHFIKKSIDLDSENDSNWLLLAKCEHGFGNEVSTIEAFIKCIELNPNNVEVYIAFSNFYFDYKHYENAFNVIIEGINVFPDNDNFNYLAFVYGLKSGKYKESLTFLENALFLAPENKDLVFQYFEDIESQKVVLKLIEGII